MQAAAVAVEDDFRFAVAVHVGAGEGIDAERPVGGDIDLSSVGRDEHGAAAGIAVAIFVILIVFIDLYRKQAELEGSDLVHLLEIFFVGAGELRPGGLVGGLHQRRRPRAGHNVVVIVAIGILRTGEDRECEYETEKKKK